MVHIKNYQYFGLSLIILEMFHSVRVDSHWLNNLRMMFRYDHHINSHPMEFSQLWDLSEKVWNHDG